MNIRVILQCAAAVAAAGVLAIGFQNCSKDPSTPQQPAPADPTDPTQGGQPSRVPPLVEALCEDVNDQSTCLTRAKCLHTDDRDCTDAAHFTGTDNTLALDKPGPVILHPGQSVSLWTSIADKNDVAYQWYKGNSFFSFNESDVSLNGQTEKYFELPGCNALGSERDPNKLNEQRVFYYYVKATYDDTTLTAPFLVACADRKSQVAGNEFRGLSASDSLSDDAVERQLCQKASCEDDDYATTGDLILIRNGDSLNLRAQIDNDEDIRYAWYESYRHEVVHQDEVVACRSGRGSGCTLCTGERTDCGSAATVANKPNTLNVAFTVAADEQAQESCRLNDVVYFHAIATKADDPSYKKQATFRVACVEALPAEPDENSREQASEGEDSTAFLWPAGEGVSEDRTSKKVTWPVDQAVDLPLPAPSNSDVYTITCSTRSNGTYTPKVMYMIRGSNEARVSWNGITFNTQNKKFTGTPVDHLEPNGQGTLNCIILQNTDEGSNTLYLNATVVRYY